ncbi:MAG: neutral/alkaline non-lysosomal ceramidase N-terminal domain-containing protein [Planctomycetes bacterium]|nr:neutral/alkaline non-lysosomal ceramidase N-terminal domain-containing protein [Planctomycetota bacterium]
MAPDRFRLCLLASIAALGLSGCSSAPLPAPAGWEEEPARSLRTWSCSGELKAGAARVLANPPYALPMAGYFGASWLNCRSSRDPIHVRALVLECGGSRVAVVSAETVLIPPGLRAEVEETPAFRRSGLRFWILGATHAHTAPGGHIEAWPAELLGTGWFDPLYRRFLVERIAEALESASRGLQPARLEFSRAQVGGVSFNRKIASVEADPELAVLSVFPLAGPAPAGSRPAAELQSPAAPLARLLRFAAHPTLIPFYRRQISGDYPGALMRLLERDGSVDLFIQGPSGDLAAGRPDDFPPLAWKRRLEEVAVRLHDAARQAERNSTRLEPAPAGGQTLYRLSSAQAEMPLPPRQPWRIPFFGRAIASHYPEKVAIRGLRIRGPGADLFIASFPGELGTDLGKQLRAAIAGAVENAGALDGVWIWTLADDYLGYAFSREAYRAGGKSGHLAAYGEGLGDHVLRAWTKLASSCGKMSP